MAVVAAKELQVMFPHLETAVLSAAIDHCCGDVEAAAVQVLERATGNTAQSFNVDMLQPELVLVDDGVDKTKDIPPKDASQQQYQESGVKRERGLTHQDTSQDCVIVCDSSCSCAMPHPKRMNGGRRGWLGASMRGDLELAMRLEKEEQEMAAQRLRRQRLREERNAALAAAIANDIEHDWRRHQRLREERDAALASAIANVMEQDWRREVQQQEDAAIALQLEEGGLQVPCRFCGAVCLAASADLAGVCTNEACTTKSQVICGKMLSCGHPCNGLRDEAACNVPCCVCSEIKDEQCGICLDKMSESPVIMLDCGHPHHYGCALNMAKNANWRGCKMAFAAVSCLSGCGKLLSHNSLSEHMDPISKRYDQVVRNVQQRAAADGCNDDLKTLLTKYKYYECYNCREPYCGGMDACAPGAPEPAPDTVLCPSCVLNGSECPKHGAEFMAVKCDYCCKEALFRCGGSTMFCAECHETAWSTKVKECNPETCPLRGNHPKGKSSQYNMGCAACRCEM